MLKNIFKIKKTKKALVWNTLIPWLIAAVVLVLVVIAIIMMRGNWGKYLEYIKEMIRFGR